MRLVAHRGFAGVNPENTVAAVERAAGVADAVEVDVRRCGSGELVAVHDPTVDRVTDGRGRVADHSLAALGGLSVEGSGEPIPALRSVVEALPAGTGLHLELKERGLARDALAAADGHDDVLVQSFLPGILEEVRGAAPDVSRGLLFAGRPDEGLARARDLGCEAVGVAHERCSPAFVEAAHDAGLRVDAWTIGDRETATRMADAGVDAIVSDYPDVL